MVDDDELFNQPQHFGVGTTNQSTCVNEYFDIIEHSTRGNKTVLIVQPSDRERFNLLSKMVSDTESANFVSKVRLHLTVTLSKRLCRVRP